MRRAALRLASLATRQAVALPAQGHSDGALRALCRAGAAATLLRDPAGAVSASGSLLLQHLVTPQHTSRAFASEADYAEDDAWYTSQAFVGKPAPGFKAPGAREGGQGRRRDA